MMGLTVLALVSVLGQPFEKETWNLLASKLIVPFVLFHLAGLVFTNEHRFRQFELFALMVLAYLSFTAIAFLSGAHSLIFPRFILDESLGFHADRARGPLLQAVANGVSLNILGPLALHAYLRGRLRGLKIAVLLASVPIAILATMTRAVWLSFAATVVVMLFLSHGRALRWACLGLALLAAGGVIVVLNSHELCAALCDRLGERGPVDYRAAVYSGGWATDRVGLSPDAGRVAATCHRIRRRRSVSAQHIPGSTGGAWGSGFGALCMADGGDVEARSRCDSKG